MISYQVSKWIKIPLLIDEEEMSLLCNALEQKSSFAFYNIHQVTPKGEGVVIKEEFLKQYALYVQALKRSEIGALDAFRHIFAHVLSGDKESLQCKIIDPERQLIKPKKPVIQLQMNQVCFSKEDSSFRTQLFGQGGIFWGVQVGFPGIFQDPKTQAICSTRACLNAELFRILQLFVREHTRATPFVVGDKRINAPMRLGKRCFSWINSHPQLKERGISVHGL